MMSNEKQLQTWHTRLRWSTGRGNANGAHSTGDLAKVLPHYQQEFWQSGRTHALIWISGGLICWNCERWNKASMKVLTLHSCKVWIPKVLHVGQQPHQRSSWNLAQRVTSSKFLYVFALFQCFYTQGGDPGIFDEIYRKATGWVGTTIWSRVAERESCWLFGPQFSAQKELYKNDYPVIYIYIVRFVKSLRSKRAPSSSGLQPKSHIKL